MYLRFIIDPSEYNPSEFGPDHIAVRSSEVWGDAVEIFDRVSEVSIIEVAVAIRFPDGSEIHDPSWMDWGVVAELPSYAIAAQALQETASGRIRTLSEPNQ